jgi:hypothetical protein
VSANEIRSVMAGVYGEPLTETEIEEVIKMADVDGDGQINYVRCACPCARANAALADGVCGPRAEQGRVNGACRGVWQRHVRLLMQIHRHTGRIKNV